jgi:hypothetical protein
MTTLFTLDADCCLDELEMEVPGLEGLEEEVNQKSEKWGFDFVKEKPLADSGYKWQKIFIKGDEVDTQSQQEESRAS